MTDHPLTETAAAELWNAHRTHNALPFHEQGRLYMQDQTAMLRATFDAGREHERTNPADARPWELPTEDVAVIVPADGHEYIETNEGVASALVHLGGKWYGGAFQINSEQIIPGTWKVDGK